jgi:hypothetical protein
MNFSISNEEQQVLNDVLSVIFPKYTSQLINWANQNAQGTRPKVVGQLSDLFPEYEAQAANISIEDWEKWYLEKYPDAIENATNKIFTQIENLKQAIQLIDKDLVRAWVKDLVLSKTFNGLYVQKVILAKLASIKNQEYRLATPDEESQGIDGYVGGKAYSIKPDTYKTMGRLSETIDVTMIYYTKTKTCLKVEIEE